MAHLREDWLTDNKPMYECRSMTKAKSKASSSSWSSASMERAMDIHDWAVVTRSCSLVRRRSGMFSVVNF